MLKEYFVGGVRVAMVIGSILVFSDAAWRWLVGA